MNAIRKSTYPGYGNGNGQQAMATSREPRFRWRIANGNEIFVKRNSTICFGYRCYTTMAFHTDYFFFLMAFIAGWFSICMMKNLLVCYTIFRLRKIAGHRFGVQQQQQVISRCHCHIKRTPNACWLDNIYNSIIVFLCVTGFIFTDSHNKAFRPKKYIIPFSRQSINLPIRRLDWTRRLNHQLIPLSFFITFLFRWPLIICHYSVE